MRRRGLMDAAAGNSKQQSSRETPRRHLRTQLDEQSHKRREGQAWRKQDLARSTGVLNTSSRRAAARRAESPDTLTTCRPTRPA